MKKLLLLATAVFTALSSFALQRLVTNTADVLSPGSFRYEVDNAFFNDTIVFDLALDTIPLDLGELNISQQIFIIGNGVGNTFLTTNNLSRLATISGNVTFEDVEILFCTGTNGGVFDLTSGTVTLQNCRLHDNMATVQGGCVNAASTLVAINTDFWNNSAPDGGAIYGISAGYNMTFTDCFFADNTATTFYGGAINMLTSSGNTIIHGCIFDNNTSSTSHGGAIDMNGAAIITIDSTDFNNNHADGDWGGALFLNTNAINVTVTDSRIHHNTASNGPALGMNSAAITFNNCIIDSNAATGSGGAIYIGAGSGNTLDANNTLFMGNNASIGGAIYTTAFGSGTHTNCTYYQNDGGSGNGGAVYSQNYDWIYNNCTFSENVTTGNGGAVYCFGSTGSYQFNRCTMTANSANHGGGLYTGSGGVVATFYSSIVAQNIASGIGIDVRNTSGGVATTGFNLIGTEDNTLTTWLASDITGSDNKPVCAKLLPIQDNGGGILTHNLNSCSPAMDLGAIGGGTDQNGTTLGALPEVGATEYAGYTGPTSADVLNSSASGPGSALDLICNTCVDTLFFNVATNGIPIQPTSHYNIDRNLTIIGNGPGVTTFDGGASSERAFDIPSGVTLKLKSLQIQDFDITGGSFQGGAVWNDGTLFTEDVVFLNNWSAEGGSIYSPAGTTLNLLNTTFQGDSTSLAPGGAIAYTGSGGLNIDSCNFISCGSISDAGAISAVPDGGIVSITACNFNGNKSANDAAAVYVSATLGNTIIVEHSQFDNNDATNASSIGGALKLYGGAQKTIDSCQFSNNLAGDGASIYIDSSAAVITNCFFDNNDATNNGGDVVITSLVSDTSKIENCAFVNDTSSSAAAAIWVDSSNVLVSRTTISGCVAATGAALVQISGGWLGLSYNTIVDNWNASGGAVYCNGGIMELTGNIIAANTQTNEDVSNAAAGITSNGFNVIGDGQTTGVAIAWQASDTTGTFIAPIDPLLEPLAFNGTSWTPTHAIACLSPALDIGGLGPALDQIGQPLFGGVYDAGAFESQIAFSLPSVNIFGDVVGCGDGQYADSLRLDLTGAPPWNVEYTDGTNTFAQTEISSTPFYFNPESSGAYVMTSVSDNLCPTGVLTGGATVIDSILNVSITLDVLPDCDSTNGSVTAVVNSGGTGAYSYLWSNGDITTSADTLGAGYQAVIVTDAVTQCNVEAIALLSNPTGPSVSIDVVLPVSCFGANDGTILATVSGFGPVTKQWSNGATSEDVVNTFGGYHSVEVTDGNGCKTLDSVFVPEPDPITMDFLTVEPNCGVVNGGIVATPAGGDGSYNYVWSSGGNTNTEAPLGFGTYSLTVTDGAGCVGADSVNLNELGSPTLVVDSIIQPDCNAGNGSIYVTGMSTGTITYDWNMGASAMEDYTGVGAALHYVTLTDGTCMSGHYVDLPSLAPPTTQICLATVDTTSENNVIVWEEIPGIEISHYDIYRKALFGGNSYQKIGSVPYDSLSFFIDTVANSDAIWWNYKIATVDSCGSQSPLSEVANHKTIHLSLYPAPIVGDVKLKWNHYSGFSFPKYYIDRYTNATGWMTIDSVANTLTEFTTTLPADTTGIIYQVFAKSPSDCNATKAIGDFNSSRSNKKSQIAGPLETGISQTDFYMDVFPNPVHDKLNIQATYPGEVERITITDNLGRVVEIVQVAGSNGRLNITLNTENLASGNYILSLQTIKGRYQHQFIKR